MSIGTSEFYYKMVAFSDRWNVPMLRIEGLVNAHKVVWVRGEGVGLDFRGFEEVTTGTLDAVCLYELLHLVEMRRMHPVESIHNFAYRLFPLKADSIKCMMIAAVKNGYTAGMREISANSHKDLKINLPHELVIDVVAAKIEQIQTYPSQIAEVGVVKVVAINHRDDRRFALGPPEPHVAVFLQSETVLPRTFTEANMQKLFSALGLTGEPSIDLIIGTITHMRLERDLLRTERDEARQAVDRLMQYPQSIQVWAEIQDEP
jgi:hypothetical protein